MGAAYHGRFTFGSYVALEKFANVDDGVNRNDLATASSRFFLHLSDLGSSNIESTLDLRDTHDLFDKVDRQKLELREGNSFQAKQASVTYPGSVVNATLGRFPISEAGSVSTDGVSVGTKFGSNWKATAFGGLNPKRIDQTYLQFNPDSNVYGAFILYQPKETTWDKALYMTNAITEQTVKSEVDRRYWYHNSIVQFSSSSRLILISYLDFVPRASLQTGSLNYYQKISNDLSTTINLLGVDVIEYSRRQGIRERLNPSPFKEGSVRTRYAFTDDMTTDFNLLYGKRESDGLSRKEVSLGINLIHLMGRRVDGYSALGHREDFLNKYSFGKFGIGYFSRIWEVTFDGELGLEVIDSKTYHLLQTELSLARYFGNSLLVSASVQDNRDERVQISSGFIKLAYRFGNRETPPVRDGAPPRGRL